MCWQAFFVGDRLALNAWVWRMAAEYLELCCFSAFFYVFFLIVFPFKQIEFAKLEWRFGHIRRTNKSNQKLCR